MLHTMMLEATDGRLYYAPIGDYPQKIIDLGTGTGTWAIQSTSQDGKKSTHYEMKLTFSSGR